MSQQFSKHYVLVIFLIISLLASFGLNQVMAGEKEGGLFASSPPFATSPLFLPYIRHDEPPPTPEPEVRRAPSMSVRPRSGNLI